MTLQEEFERSGAWLFRWRSYLPLALTSIILPAMLQFHYPGDSKKLHDLWAMACLLVSFFGLGVRIITTGHTSKRTSGRNTKRQAANTLNTTGMYSIVRHPLYVGNLFMFIGPVLYLHLWWLTLIYLLLFWLYYERIMFAEEAFLRKKFGDAFLTWANKTPAFLPRFKNYVKADLPFSTKRVLKKEYNGFFAVIVAIFILKQLGEMVMNEKFHLDLPWAALLSFGFIVWVTLRILKKRTTLLSEHNR